MCPLCIAGAAQCFLGATVIGGLGVFVAKALRLTTRERK